MRKLTITALSLALIGVSAFSGVALAAHPKPGGFYCSKYDCMGVDQAGKEVNNFQGRCKASKHPKFSFEAFFIRINRKGKFHYDKQNPVNTPDGGTLAKTSRVTIDGKFISKREAKGTYRLHKHGCKKVRFDAKLSK